MYSNFQIDNLLEDVIVKTSAKINKDVPGIVTTIVSVLRKMTKPEIMEVVTKYFSSSITTPSRTTEKKR